MSAFSPFAAPWETARGVAHPWLCDAQGHMNTRFYAALFDDAGMQFMAALVPAPAAETDENMGWADVRHVVEFHREVRVGALLAVETRLVRLGTKSLTIRHQLRALPGPSPCASMEATIVCFDLLKREARPLPASLRGDSGATRPGSPEE